MPGISFSRGSLIFVAIFIVIIVSLIFFFAFDFNAIISVISSIFALLNIVFGFTFSKNVLRKIIERGKLKRETPELSVDRDKFKRQYPEFSIAEIIFNVNKKRTLWASLVLLCAVLLHYAASLLFNVTKEPLVLILAASVLILLFVQDRLLEYRVGKRYYGTNESEAREIIRFISSQVQNIDFTDRGKPKKMMSDAELEEFAKFPRKVKLQPGELAT